MTDIIGAFWDAFQAEDMTGIRSVYPGITAEQRQAWSGLFDNAERVAVTHSIGAFSLRSTLATVQMSVEWEIRVSGRNLRQNFDGRATFQLEGTRWAMTAYEQDQR